MPSSSSTLPLLALLIFALTAATSVSGCCGLTGCNLFGSNKYYYDSSYTLTLTGLNNYTGSEGFRILVPVPVLSGEAMYTDAEIRSADLIFPPPVSVFADYETVHTSKLVNNTGWTAALVTTDYGPMIQLTPANASLSDLELLLFTDKEVPEADSGKFSRGTDPQAGMPLAPISAETSGSYSVPPSYSYGNYSSVVLFDGSLAPRQGEAAGNISLNVAYHELFAQGSVPVFREECRIDEAIPGNVTGWIPVRVEKTG